MPSGEAHAVLMRARQQRADGADTFLSVKPRNAVLSENPRVEHQAVVSADKQTVLWDSNRETPLVTVYKSPNKNQCAPVTLGVHYPGGTPRSPRPSTSPRREQDDGFDKQSPNKHFSQRPKEWR